MFSNADTVQVEHVLEEKSYCEKNNSNTYSDEMLMEKVKETLSLFCDLGIEQTLDNEEAVTGCKPIDSQISLPLDGHSNEAYGNEQLVSKFLTYIYNQIDGLIERCPIQSTSRSSTPVSVARQAPLARSEKTTTSQPCKVSDNKGSGANSKIFHAAAGSHCTDRSTPRKSVSGGKQTRRVQLFSANGSGNLESCVSPLSKVKSSPSREEFAPLRFSTPSHSSASQHNGQSSLTLADFITPERRKKKRHERKQTSRTVNSPSYGSWASGVGEGEITPLQGNALSNGVSNCSQILDQTDIINGSKEISNSEPSELSAATQLREDNPKPSRRITPTVVKEDTVWHKFKQQAVFAPCSPKKCVSAPTPGRFDAERQQLREKKAQFMTLVTETSSKSPQDPATPSKSYSSKLSSEQCVEPQPDLVTFTTQLDKAASTFASLISGGKTPNITTDLHLLTQVLCCQVPENSVNEERTSDRASLKLLHSVHNGVYFAIAVLRNSQVLQYLLDSGIARLISENDRVGRFDSAFAAHLQPSKLDHLSCAGNTSAFSSVSFQADTDNAKNFPSERAFIVFKKQRDLFYEIKRDWDSNHSVPGWSFKIKCSQKIFQLLNNGGVDVSNYVHLARLFVNQLIISCLRGVDEGWRGADEESVSLLSNLKQSQPEKYRKLRERFVMPLSTSTHLNTEAMFTGQEHFFKLFIDIANDVTFTQHLKDLLTLRLLDLNQTEFEDFNEPDSDLIAALGIFSDCILTSRLLAKFLGYLNFLPYACSEKLTLALDKQYQLLRECSAPPLDVSQLLATAMQESRCRILIPWLVQYLSHADPYTVSMPYYKQVLTSLWRYFQQLKILLRHKQCIADVLLQYVSLSWLFNLSHFDHTHIDNQKDVEVTGLFSGNSLVSLNLVYKCSDILRCVKGVLVEYVMGMKSKVGVSRKIKPLTADSSESLTLKMRASASTESASNLQLILEDNFFQNQPASLKKSAGFIAERVSSSYIKEFRADTLAKNLLEYRLQVYNHASQVPAQEELKEKLASVITSKAKILWSDLYEEAVKGVKQYFNARVPEILKLLLPSSTESYVVKICTAVIYRQGYNRVVQWLEANLTLDYITSELNHELTKYCRNSGKNAAPDVVTEVFAQLKFDHSDSSPSPSDTLMQLQLFTGKVLSNPHRPIKPTDLETTLSQTVACITGRSDILSIALKTMCHLIVLLLVSVATHQAKVIAPETIRLLNTLFNVEELQIYWKEFITVVPSVDDCHNENSSLQAKLFNYILIQKSLPSSC